MVTMVIKLQDKTTRFCASADQLFLLSQMANPDNLQQLMPDSFPELRSDAVSAVFEKIDNLYASLVVKCKLMEKL